MEKVKKITNILTSIMLVLFIVFAALLVGVRLLGIEPYVVLSGSMEPEIYTGSLIYVDPITPEQACDLKVGDTVTYIVDKKGTKVTHKIYEVVGPAYVKNQYGEIQLDENGEKLVAKDDNGYPIIMYVTYGINNKNEGAESGYTLDGKPGVGNLASSNVIGKPIVSVPLLGYVTHFVQNPPGKYVTLIICATLILTSVFGGSSENKPVKEAVSEGDGDGKGDSESTEDTPENKTE